MPAIECSDERVGRLIYFYEFDQLRKKDRCRFEDHLMECRFCSRELQEMLPMVWALRERRAELLERLALEGITYAQQKEILKEAYQSQRATVGGRSIREVVQRWLLLLIRPRVLIPVLGVGAAVILILVLPWNKSGNPYLPYLDRSPVPYDESTLRGTAEPVPEEAWQAFDAGMADYLRGDYGKAANSLQKAAKLAPEESEFQLYLGVSRYLAGRPKDAVETLIRALSTKDEGIRGTARWYLAQTWLAQREPAKAQPLLEEIVRQRDEYSVRADSLLARIKTLK